MPDKTLGEHYRGKEITEDKLSEAVSDYRKKSEASERKTRALTLDVGAAIEAHTFSRDVLARAEASERPRRSAMRAKILLAPTKGGPARLFTEALESWLYPQAPALCLPTQERSMFFTRLLGAVGFALALCSAPAALAQNNSWNGNWTGTWNAINQSSFSISNGICTNFSYKGALVQIESSKISANTLTINTSNIKITLTLQNASHAAGQLRGPIETVFGTFTKQ